MTNPLAGIVGLLQPSAPSDDPVTRLMASLGIRPDATSTSGGRAQSLETRAQDLQQVANTQAQASDAEKGWANFLNRTVADDGKADKMYDVSRLDKGTSANNAALAKALLAHAAILRRTP